MADGIMIPLLLPILNIVVFVVMPQSYNNILLYRNML